MTRREALGLAAGAAVAALPAQAADVDIDSNQFMNDLVEFNRAFNEFFRTKFGCPSGAARLEECDEKLGHFDYGAYMKAVKLSKKIFPKGN